MSMQQKQRKPNSSITGVQSFRPELEFEIIKTVMLRESYLKRITKSLKESDGKIDMGLIGMIDTLRECSLECVDVIQTWERTQLDYPEDVKPFVWNGTNYLSKMITDYQVFQDFPSVEKWLGFSPECNPFFIPPEALDKKLDLQGNSFVVFGTRPPPPKEPPKAKPIMPKFVKSPYLTPIHNDLDIFPQNSAVNKAKKREKLRGEAQAAADALQQVGKDKAKDALTDPFQSFVSASTIERANKLLEVLIKNNNGFPLFDPTQSLAGSYNPSSSFVTAMEPEGSSTMPPGPGSPMRTMQQPKASEDTLPPVPAMQQELGSSLDRDSLEELPQPVPAQAPGSVMKPVPGSSLSSSPTHQAKPAPSSPHKQSMKAAVGTTGSFAGRLGSTSIFSQNREDFESTQDGFRQTLSASFSDAKLENKSMRLESIVDKSMAEKAHGQFTSQLDSSFASQSTATTNASQVWTPHEITLQRAVRRRGGELFVLTAAGTRGHIKAPTRRTRYERLKKDMDALESQAVAVERSIEEKKAELEEVRKEFEALEEPSKKQRKKMLKRENEFHGLVESKRGIENYQHTLREHYDNYKIVMDSEPSDLEKQRKMHSELKDGQVLPSDQELSMKLEDKMAGRIQRGIKRAIGRQLRKCEWERRHAAARIIQNLARRKQNEGKAYERGIRLAIAIRMQKLARGMGGKNAMKSMAIYMRKKRATQLLMRVARGFIARNRTRRKRLFIRAVINAHHHASLDCITPDNLDDLADLIESYQRDYTIAVPIQVMTVLRGLLYMQIGDHEEELTVDNAGYVETLTLYADTAGWNGFRLLLRRKGRFMRKVRAMVQFINLPGPRALEFTDETVEHLNAIVKNIKNENFDSLDARNKDTLIHFLEIIRNIKIAYDFQSEFPEYFIPQTPRWYARASTNQRKYQNAMAENSMYRYCKKQIDIMREEFKEKGKAWRPVALAAQQNELDIARSEEEAQKALAAYNKDIEQFEREEAMSISLINGFKLTREIGVVVAKRDWEAFYEKEGDVAPEWRIAQQRLVVDKAELALLESQNKIFFAEKSKLRDERARDFGSILQLAETRRICKAEGTLMGKLMVMQYVWENFVDSIGGFQYVFDLKGEKKQYFLDTKKDVQEALLERRRLMKLRNKELDYQFQRAHDLAHAARMGEFTATWDVPTDMERISELAEDTECRKRDADLEGKAARAAKRMKIPPAPFRPLMLLIDTRIPRSIKAIIRKRLVPLHFQEIIGDIEDPRLTLKVQRMMDTRWNIFIFADRGTNNQARTAFLGYFRSLLYSLIPRPRVVALDSFLELRYDNWYLDTAAEWGEIFRSNSHNSTEASLLLSRLRKTALVFKQCLIFETKQEEIEAGATAVVPPWLRVIFKNDLDAFMSEIEASGDERDTLMSTGKAIDNASKILAATIAAAIGWWKAPLLQWREQQIRDGCEAFTEHVADAPALCEMLWFRKFPDSKVKSLKRLQNAQKLTHVWEKISKANFYEMPARNLLARWCLEAMDLVTGIVQQGGGADENFDNCPVVYAHNLNWKDDVADLETRAEQMIGQLLHECLAENLIYEEREVLVNEYRARDDIEDVEAQFFASEACPRVVRVYHSDTRAYVGVERPGMSGEKSTWQFFDQMDIIEFVTMLQPNATELYEGTVDRRDIGENGSDKWWELLAQWCRLEHIGKTCRFSLMRARYLMLTKLGKLNGYTVRYELFEERYAEIMILVHGLPGTGTIYFRVNKKMIAELLASCDPYIEKLPIQMQEALSIAYIFSDRLQARPTRNQLWWLNNGELEPKRLWGEKPIKVSLRYKGGPGRQAGRKMYTLNGIFIVITIYEVSNPSDIQSLRVVLYDCTHCQQAEFRLSEMERVGLFHDDSSILDQIFARIKTVFTRVYSFEDFDRSSRATILLQPDYKLSEEPLYTCEGDTEYLLLDDKEVEYSRSHAESDDEIHSRTSSRISSKRGTETDKDLVDADLSDDDSQLIALRNLTAAREEEAAAEALAILEEKSAKPWHWCMYFSRTIIEESLGNLTISAGLNTSKEGFDFYILDNRTLREMYKFITWKDALPYFYGTTMAAFRKRLKNVNENLVFEMVDELFSTMEINPSEGDEGVGVDILALHSAQEEVNPYVLAYLRELDGDETVASGNRRIKAQKIEVKRFEIQALAARNLATLSGIAARNPTAVVKWNMRELGHTTPMKHTCDPDWDDIGLKAATSKEKPFDKCVLEIDVFDYNFQKARTTEFLGAVRLKGDSLKELFDNGAKRELTTIPLGRSNRMNDKENEFVGGEIVLFGLAEEHWGKINPPQTYRIVDAEDQLEYEKAIKEEQRQFDKQQAAEEKAKNGRDRWSLWGGSKKEEKTETETKEGKQEESIAIVRARPDIKDKPEPKIDVLANRPSSRESVRFKPVDRSIRFSMRHKSPAQRKLSLLKAAAAAGGGAGGSGNEQQRSIVNNPFLNSRSSRGAPVGSTRGISSRGNSGKSDALQARHEIGIEKETLGDLEENSLDKVDSTSGSRLLADVGFGGSTVISEGLGASVLTAAESLQQEMANIPDTQRSRAVTDDTYENPGSDFDDYIPHVFKVKLHQLEGIPHHCNHVIALVKFNGYEAGRTESLKCVPTVVENEFKELELAIGDDRNRQEIFRQRDWEEMKKDDEVYKKKAEAHAAKLKREAEALAKANAEEGDEATVDAADSINDDATAMGSLSVAEESVESTIAETKDATASLDEESFISEDRRVVQVAREEESIKTYVIPDRIRRSDVNHVAVFPKNTSFEMTVPSNMDINSCSMNIELWDADEAELLGEVDLRGVKLKAFVEEHGLAKQWVEFHDTFAGDTCLFENSCGDMIPLRVMATTTDNSNIFDPDFVPQDPRYFVIRMKAIKFVPPDFIPMWKLPVEKPPDDSSTIDDETQSKQMGTFAALSEEELAAAVSTAQSKIDSRNSSKLKSIKGSDSDDDDDDDDGDDGDNDGSVESYDSDEEEWRNKTKEETGIFCEVLIDDEPTFITKVLHGLENGQIELNWDKKDPDSFIHLTFDPDWDLRTMRLTLNIFSKDGMLLHKRPKPRVQGSKANDKEEVDQEEVDDEADMDAQEEINIFDEDGRIRECEAIRIIGSRTITGDILEAFMTRTKAEADPSEKADEATTVASYLEVQSLNKDSTAVETMGSDAKSSGGEDSQAIAITDSKTAEGSHVDIDAKPGSSLVSGAKNVSFVDDATALAKEDDKSKIFSGEAKDGGKYDDDDDDDDDEEGIINVDDPEHGFMTFPLNLKARLSSELFDPEPDPVKNENEWFAWNAREEIRQEDNKKARTCQIDLVAYERPQVESDLTTADDIDFITGYTSRPGTALSPPLTASRNKNTDTNMPNLNMSTMRITSSGRPDTGHSQGKNVATAPAMFSGGLTLDGFAFGGTDAFNRPGRVNIYRQNPMSETQDLQRRKLYLSIRSISAEGKKPTQGMLAGFGGWGFGASKPVEEDTRENKSVKLSLSKSRQADGISFLHRYIDCARFLGPKEILEEEVDGNDDENGLEDEEVFEEVVQSSERKRARSSMLLSRQGSVSIMQKKNHFLSRKRAHEDSVFDEEKTLEDDDKSETASQPSVYSDVSDPAHISKRQRTDDGPNSSSKEEQSSAKRSSFRSEGASVNDHDSAGSNVKKTPVTSIDGDGVAAEVTSVQDEPEPETKPEAENLIDHHAFREVQVFFNGFFIHEMFVPILYSEEENPDHLDGDHAGMLHTPELYKIPLFVPRGQLLESCRLELVIYQINKENKKEKVVGVRIFEGADLLNLFNIDAPAQRLNPPDTAGSVSDDVKSIPGSAVSFSGLPEEEEEKEKEREEVQQVILESPRPGGDGGTKYYDMEVPGSFNENADEGIALAAEKAELAGAAEPDFANLTSDLNLGVTVHNQERISASREKSSRGLQSARRKVEIRLLGITGLIGSMKMNPTRVKKAIPKEKLTDPVLPPTDVIAEGKEEDDESASLVTEVEDSQTKQSTSLDIAANQGDVDVSSKVINDFGGLSVLTGGSEFDSQVGSGSQVRFENENDEATKEEEEPAVQPRKESVDLKHPNPNTSESLSMDSITDKSSADNTVNEVDDVYIVVRWNGQDICQSHPMPPSNTILFADGNTKYDGVPVSSATTAKSGASGGKKTAAISEPQACIFAPVVDPVASSTFSMYVPIGHRLQGCYLEVVVMQNGSCLGSTMLHGEDLISFLEGFGSVTEDEDFYEDFDLEDDVATNHRSYPLQYSPSVPRSVQPEELKGRLILRGRVGNEDGSDVVSRRPRTTTNPFDSQKDHQFHTSVSIKKKTHAVSMFKIRSKMKFDDYDYRYFFDKKVERSVMKLIKAESEEKDRAANLQGDEYRLYHFNQAVLNAKRKGRPIPKMDEGLLALQKNVQPEASQELDELTIGSSIIEEGMVHEEETEAAKVERTSKEILAAFPEQRTGINLPKPFKLPMLRFKMELSAVKYVQVNESLQEDARICWKGRAMPKHFKGTITEDLQKSMMKSRSSRLIRMKGLDNMKLLSDVHFLKDMGSAKQSSADALPITVKEIVSNGPGLCKRLYRVEIQTNAGQPIGFADIETDTDMIRHVGVKNADIFGYDGRKKWDMASIFAFIVNERCEIDFMPTERKKVVTEKVAKRNKKAADFQTKKVDSNRREALSAAAGEEAKSKSVVKLMKDEIVPSEVKFTALYGAKGFSTNLDAYDDDEMKQEVKRLSGMGDELSTQLGRAAAASKNKASELNAVNEGDEDEDTYASSDDVSLTSSSSSSSETESESEEEDIPEQFLRIYTKKHRMGGVIFKSIIMLSGKIANLFLEPNAYFVDNSLKEALHELTVHFRCNDQFTKITHELQFSGHEILGWLSQMPTIPITDLRNAYRRSKFGELLLKNLVLRYSRNGEIILDLINEEIGQITKQVKEMGDDINVIQLAGGANAKDIASKRAQMRAEQAANARADRKARREEKREKLRQLEAERERVQKEKEAEIAAAKAKASQSAASAGAAAAGAALSNAAGAAKAAFKNMFSW